MQKPDCQVNRRTKHFLIYQMQMATSEDFKEGITAFMQKRPAEFKGR